MAVVGGGHDRNAPLSNAHAIVSTSPMREAKQLPKEYESTWNKNRKGKSAVDKGHFGELPPQG